MGFLSRIVRKTGNVAGSVARVTGRNIGTIGKAINNPIVQAGASLIPGGGILAKGLGIAAKAATAYGVYSAGKSALGALTGGGAPLAGAGYTGGALPPLPSMQYGAPRMSTAYAQGRSLPMGQTGATWNPMTWIPRGAGGRMQLPWNDPRTPEALKQFALDDSALSLAVKAPRGYVVVRDAEGRPFPVLKVMARKFGLWKPAKKPPISVKDWSALQRSDRVVKKLGKIANMAKKVKNAKVRKGKK